MNLSLNLNPFSIKSEPIRKMNPLGFCILFSDYSQKILQKIIRFLQYFFIQGTDLVYHTLLVCIKFRNDTMQDLSSWLLLEIVIKYPHRWTWFLKGYVGYYNKGLLHRKNSFKLRNWGISKEVGEKSNDKFTNRENL